MVAIRILGVVTAAQEQDCVPMLALQILGQFHAILGLVRLCRIGGSELFPAGLLL
jgi:hypothetical protein